MSRKLRKSLAKMARCRQLPPCRKRRQLERSRPSDQLLCRPSRRTRLLNRQNLYQKLYKSYNDAIMSRGNNQDVGQDAAEDESKRQASENAPEAAPPRDPAAG